MTMDMIQLNIKKSSPLDSELIYFIDSINNKNRNLDNFEISTNVVKILENIGEIKNE